MQRGGRDGVVVVLRRRVVVGEDVVDGWVVGFRRGGRVIVGGCGCGEEGEQGLEVGRVRRGLEVGRLRGLVGEEVVGGAG